MENSEKFLYTFNKIDKFLSDELKVGNNYTSFSSSVKKAAVINIIIRRYKDDLLEFAELRNAIVHERTDPEFPIAEPHDTIVEKIEKIYNELSAPKKVLPIFKREVKVFRYTDKLTSLLKVIKDTSYSHFPVYNGKEFKGLVTENGVTNWFATAVEKGEIPVETTTLDEILKYEEATENYRFISRDTTIYEAEDIFKNQVHREERIDAILITENGKTNEKLLGMISTWDIIDVT